MRKNMRKRNGLIVYSSKKIKLTKREKEEHDLRLAREMEKHKRDSECGGIDVRGNYTRLHDRFGLKD